MARRKRHQPITVLRKRAELIHDNIRFQNNVRNARDRATLRTEQQRLGSLMYESISPGLRERITQRRENISHLLTNPAV